MKHCIKKVIVIVLLLLTNGSLYAPFGPSNQGYAKDTNAQVYESVGFDSTNAIYVVGGQTTAPEGYVAAYTSNGLSPFDAPFTSNNPSTFSKIVVDGTGLVLAAGGATSSSQTEPVIVRYITSSTPVTIAQSSAFGGGGDIILPAIQAQWQSFVQVPGSSPETVILVGQAYTTTGIIAEMKVNNTTYGLNTGFNSVGYLLPTTSGSLNSSFGNSGQTFLDPSGGSNDMFNRVTVDPQGTYAGSFIAVGQHNNTNGMIARFTSSGTLDTTNFANPHGYFIDTTSSSVVYNAVASIIIGANTYYIAVGQCTNGGPRGLIACFTSSGSLYSGWGQGSGYVQDATAYTYSGVAIDGDNRIIVVGETAAGQHGLIARYLSTGVLDSTTGNFGTNGYATAAFSKAFNSVVISGSEGGGTEKIVVVGANSSNEGVIARYYNDVTGQTAGTLDASFNSTGTQGYYTDTISGAQNYQNVTIDGSGNIVTVGSTASEGVIVRYTPAGALDTTYFNPNGVHGGQGYANSSFATADLIEYYQGIVVDEQGNYVVTGYGFSGANGVASVIRYLGGSVLGTGTLDTSFNNSGYKTYIPGSDANASYNSVLINSGGNIITAGQGGTGGNSAVIASYLSYNPTVSAYNDVTYDSGRTTHNDFIVAVGTTPSNGPILTSYTTAGATVAGGFNLTNPPGITTGDLNSINAVSIGGTTYYVVAGYSGTQSSGYVGIVDQGGTAYSTFNGNTGAGGGSGYVTPHTTDGSTLYYKAILATINSTQCIVAVGTNGTNGVISVFTLSGGFYSYFNNGFVTSPSTGPNAAILYDVYVDTSGNVVVVGITTDNEGIIARYTPNGSLDATQTTTTITELVGAFTISGPNFFSDGALNLTRTNIVNRGGTPLQDITSFTTEVGGAFTNPDVITSIDLSGNQIATLPTGAFNGTTFTNLTDIIIDNNTVAMTIDATPFENFNGANNSDLTVSINQNTNLTALPAQLFSNTTTLGGLDLSSDGLTSVPATLLNGVTTINGNLNFAGNTGLTAIPEGLLSGITSTGNLTLTSLSLTQLSLANATFQGTVNASDTSIAGVNDTALSNATIGTLNLNNSQVAAGNISLFSMDTASITTITLSGAPVVGAAPANIQTQLNNGISSAALGDFLHSRQSRDIITPIGYAGITEHYQSLNKPTGF